MILTLHGAVTAKTSAHATIEGSGTGYQVYMGTDTLASMHIGATVCLWTYEHIREAMHDMYGFRTEREHSLFLRLVDVSGVGPRMAVNILALGAPESIERSIEAGDVDYLSRVPGVGKKTAQKII